MGEDTMVEVLQKAIADHGIQDTIEAAGQFEPRGHVGAMFAGGMAGGEIGGLLGQTGDAIGTVGGAIAAGHEADRNSGLPAEMLLGVSSSAVYGFAGRSRSQEPTELVFQVPREGLTAKVHQRVNVRVLELIHDDGSRIELEGNRIPLTHSKDVIEALTG
ncbi:MAG TPA: hypothetical protein VK646_05245 [Actinomycetota bacterium]|nr:hypothetical protein [Actinomycetota bacterium]